MGWQHGLVAAILTVAGLVAASVPPAIIIGEHIWAPVTMTHETFGVHFTAYLMLRHTYYFVRNAHFFTLAYTYLPNWLAWHVFGQLTDFARTEVYIDLVYLLHALVLGTLLVWVAWSRLALGEKLMLGFVGCAPYYLTNKIVPALTVNYHLLEAVLFLVLGYLLMQWGGGRLVVSRPLVVGLAAIAALAAGTKLTLLVLIVPYCALLAMPLGASWRRRIGWLLFFGLCWVGISLLLLVAYLQGHVEWIPRFAGDVIRLNLDPSWLGQNVPWLHEQAFETFFKESSVFGVQITGVAFVALMALLAGASFARRDETGLLFVGVSALVGLFCAYFVVRRTAPNTFVEIGAFLVFAVSVAASLLARRSWLGHAAWGQALPLGVAAALAGLAYIGLYVNNNPALGLEVYRQTSDRARALHAYLDSFPDLPIVIYSESGNASQLYPSPHLYSLLSGEPGPLLDVFMPTYFPRVHFRQPDEGLFQGPHMMVVPEFSGDEGHYSFGLGSPLYRFTEYPPLEAVRSDPANHCQVFSFRGDREETWPLIGEASQVTVCEVRKEPAPFGGTNPGPPLTGRLNLAIGKPVQQISTAEASVAGQGADGLASREKVSVSLAQTKVAYQPWWEVDLGSDQPIDAIRIWGPGGGAKPMQAVHVFVSSQPFGDADAADTMHRPDVRDWFIDDVIGTPTTIPVNGVGRYVRLQRAGSGYLEVGEVEVLAPARAAPDAPAGQNLAAGSLVSMSSTASGDNPASAVDGSTDDPNPVESRREINPSLTVDLGERRRIGSIALWNRPEEPKESMRNLYVFVSDEPFASDGMVATARQPGVRGYFIGPVVGRPTMFSVDGVGRYVRVQMTDEGTLSLAEIQVFGEATGP
jgi:hypothetical protein